MQCKVSFDLGNSKCWLFISDFTKKHRSTKSSSCEAGEPICHGSFEDFGLGVLHVKKFIDFNTRREICSAFAVLNLWRTRKLHEEDQYSIICMFRCQC